MEPLLYIVVSLAVGAAIGFLLARALRRDDAQTAVLLSENAGLQQEVLRLRSEGEAKEQELRKTLERAAASETENKTLEARVAAQKAETLELQKTMEMKFENLAQKIFSQKAEEFSQKSAKDIGVLLNPLKQGLEGFQKKVDESFGIQRTEQASLKTQIEMIAKASGDMKLQAESLAKALRGDVKAQGNWGEVILERLLEESGLREGTEYTLQGSKLDLKDMEGRTQKPDVIIHLPEGRHIIIDAKVSLTHYEQYCAETEEDKKPGYLKQFVDSLRQHINGLSGKGYQHQENLNTPDVVIMFLPIEGSFSLALQMDPQLFNYAWQRKITIAHPSTLFAMLHVVKSLWNVETQNKNVQEIARQGGALYDKFVGFVEDMQEIGDRLKQTDKAYSGAMNKLVEGTGSLVNRTESLRKLGAKTSKQLPKELVAENKQLEKIDA